MIRANVKPSLITWARERAGLESADLAHRFPKLEAWEAGETLPTLKQVEDFAHAVHVPVGYLFLPAPPDELLPIPDFRTMTMAGQPVRRASPDLLNTIYMAQERQDWYREFALMTREPEAGFVGSLTTNTPVPKAAAAIAEVLGFDLGARTDCPTWEEALRLLIGQAERVGVLVMVSGVVLSNNRRRLDPQEFQGFALIDDRAPLVFINVADTKADPMFTLAYELAHLWLGVSALSSADAAPVNGHQEEEVWCNAVAMELLAPLAVVRAELLPGEELDETLKRLARWFKVSTLAILRRLLDAGVLDRAGFEAAWQAELNRLAPFALGGGNFYRTTLFRVSRRFARALVASTLEGQTLYRDAFRMLGVTNSETFNKIGRKVGVVR